MDPVKVNRKKRGAESSTSTNHPAFTLPADSVYFLIARMTLEQPISQSANFTVEISWLAADGGHLSAVDRPLLTFFASMCFVYAIFALFWAVMCASRWKDLLQIQFWIGAVILLGMVEKAAFYAEYETVDATGWPVFGVIQLAESVSCVKRTLARLLVIIASLGFGVVRPRLGPDLNKLVALGLVYFVLASLEANIRVARSLGYKTSERRLAGLPLIAVEIITFWWVCTSLAGTMRALKLRKNTTKLSLYRHFTNTLIFGAVSSAIFMAWSLWRHALAKCVTDWKEMWVDVAFWHVLFSGVLLIIMILWRPSRNDQRYAFAPLINEDSEDDDVIFTGAFVTGDAMKMRSHNENNGDNDTEPNKLSNRHNRSNDADEDLQRELRWVEENIPSSLADQLVADSEEEVAQTRFEVGKMQ